MDAIFCDWNPFSHFHLRNQKQAIDQSVEKGTFQISEDFLTKRRLKKLNLTKQKFQIHLIFMENSI